MSWAYPNVNQHFPSKSWSESLSVCPAQFRFQQNGDTKKKPHIPKQAWKALPPPSRTSESKEVDGETWHWCAPCGCCCLSHDTADHKDPSQLLPLTSKSNSQATSVSASTATALLMHDYNFVEMQC